MLLKESRKSIRPLVLFLFVTQDIFSVAFSSYLFFYIWQLHRYIFLPHNILIPGERTHRNIESASRFHTFEDYLIVLNIFCWQSIMSSSKVSEPREPKTCYFSVPTLIASDAKGLPVAQEWSLNYENIQSKQWKATLLDTHHVAIPTIIVSASSEEARVLMSLISPPVVLL